MNFPLLTKDWTAAEDLQLIAGIMKCGLGNWEDVHEQFLQGRTPQECEEHYFSVIYQSTSASHPSISYSPLVSARAPLSKDCLLDADLLNEQAAKLAEYRQR